jgi:hypothetical protein
MPSACDLPRLSLLTIDRPTDNQQYMHNSPPSASKTIIPSDRPRSYVISLRLFLLLPVTFV